MEPKNYHVWAHRQAVLLAAAAAATIARPEISTSKHDGGGSSCSGSGIAASAAASASTEAAGSSGGGGGGRCADASNAKGTWAAELELASVHIREDVRNNSAWAQRFFVLQHWYAMKACHAGLDSLCTQRLPCTAVFWTIPHPMQPALTTSKGKH